MGFLRTFFGSFHSQALYTRLRVSDSGYGFHYSLLLLGFVTVISTIIVMLHLPEQFESMMPKMQEAPLISLALIAVVAILLRGTMLLALAISARLLALKLKLPMDYAAGFRIAGVAYTPIAVLDGALLCLGSSMYGMTGYPLMLFFGGFIMLLGALFSTRKAA